MATSLSRAEVEAQIAAYIAGNISSNKLADWAFDQVCDEEEERLVFEQGYEAAIADVLDDLMWVDDRAFNIDADGARELVTRLNDPTPDEESDDAESEEW